MPRKTCKRKSRVGDSNDISHSGNVNSDIVKKKESGSKLAADSSPRKRETAFAHLTRRHSRTTGTCPVAGKEDPEKLIKSKDKNTKKKIRRDIEEMDNRNPSSGRVSFDGGIQSLQASNTVSRIVWHIDFSSCHHNTKILNLWHCSRLVIALEDIRGKYSVVCFPGSKSQVG